MQILNIDLHMQIHLNKNKSFLFILLNDEQIVSLELHDGFYNILFGGICYTTFLTFFFDGINILMHSKQKQLTIIYFFSFSLSKENNFFITIKLLKFFFHFTILRHLWYIFFWH